MSALTGVVGKALARRPLEQTAAAGRALAGHLDDDRHREAALRVAGTGKEAAKAAVFVHELAPAVRADLVRLLIRHLEVLALKLDLSVVEVCVKVLIILAQQVLPRDGSGLDLVEIGLHVGGEFQVDDIAEILLHHLGHDDAEIRRAQIAPLLDDIVAAEDGRDRRRIRRRTADALFLHRTDKRRLRVAGGWLGKLLLFRDVLELHGVALLERRQRTAHLARLLVLRLFVHGGVARKLLLGVVGAEEIARAAGIHDDVIIHGIGHLAGGEAAPDEPVETVLLRCEVVAHTIRRERDIRRANGLMRVLRTGLGLIRARLAGMILRAVVLDDERLCRGERLVRQTLGVGTHIGDEADRAAVGNIHALIQLLRDRHGAPRRHAQTAGSLLLQGRGDERGRGAALLLAALDARDLKRLGGHGGNDLVGRGLVRDVHFLIIGRAVKARTERARAAVKQRVEQPVFLRLEGADLIFAVNHDACGHRLHAPGGQAGLDLAPEQRAELVAHNAVEHAARLLRIDQVLIDLARVLDALGDDLLRDLVESHALGLVVRQIQQLLQVPRNGLSLAVRVGREIDGSGRFGALFQVGDHVGAILHGQILRREVAVNIDAHRALGQVAQMAHRGHDLIVAAQIFFDCSGLRRRLDDHQIRFCFCHRVCSNSL